MKLPWVSRERLDQAEATATEWQARYDELLAKHMTAIAPQAQTVAGASKLTTAIRDLSRQADGSIDSRLVNHFRAEANRLQGEGMVVDDVITIISTWDTSETTSRMTADSIATMAESEDRR